MRQIEQRLYRTTALRSVTDAYGHGLHRAWLAGARDITDEVVARDTVVLAPHPDDESLACGGTIAAKLAAGRSVLVVVATDGRASHPRSALISPAELAARRQGELHEACSRLGLTAADVVALQMEDGCLERDIDELRLRLIDVLRRRDPPEVLVPAAIDANGDHRALHRAARAACAHLGRQPVTLSYPVWTWDPRAWIDRATPRWRWAGQLATGPLRAYRSARRAVVDVSAHVARKHHAIEAYQSQLSNLTGEADWATLDPAFLAHFSGPRELFLEER